ncbi:maltokinase N-terminal cap-like domain-containing protein [Flexivirga alba]|uniref:Maltokinase N-terminal cap domain-containing protein n=1 Tax=Flexivirga alba TaxID=702742 RepID=A0ABW2AH02_9MICO
MAIIHHATLQPSKEELLSGWIGTQRWYAGKGGTPKLTRLGSYRFDDPAGQVGVEINIVADSSTGESVVYQIPMTYRGAPLEGADHALIGGWSTRRSGTAGSTTAAMTRSSWRPCCAP